MPAASDSISIATYLLLAAGAAVIAGLLTWLHRSYPRRYLADWGLSWLALGGYYLLAAYAFALSADLPAVHPLRLAATTGSLVLAVAQLAWLLRGTRDMSTGKRIPLPRFALSLAAIAVLATVAVVATVAVPIEQRLFVRVGLRSLAAAIVFVGASLAVRRATRRHGGIGPRLLAGALALYGLDQLLYFSKLAALLAGASFVLPQSFFSQLDFLLQMVVGLGMTVWLLEDEHRKLRNTSRELAIDQQRLNLVFDQMPVIVWSIDREERFQSSLGSGLGAIGLSPGQVVGMRLEEYLGGNDEGRRSIAAHRRALAGESVAFDLAWHDRQLHVRLEPLRESDGAIVGCVGVAIDVTEEHRREAAYSETQKLESLGVLAGGIAHDLGNLMTGVLGHAELAQRQLPEGSPAHPHLERSIEGALRGGDLARQLLAYAGRGEARRERLHLPELVRSMGDLLRVAIPPTCELRYELDGDLPPVLADPAQLRQVVMNLITNASESLGGAAGTLTIGTAARRINNGELAAFRFGDQITAGEFLSLRVTDTGTGMDASTQSRIFEPFFTTKATGRGLGLAAVLGIVRRHGGAIRVDSTPGAGTAFEILLPTSAVHDTAPN